MKTKIVYTLASDLSDLYLEQALVSVASARLHNPDAHIALVTDELTAATCQDAMRSDFLRNFDEIKVVDTSGCESKLLRSRYLKTTLRRQIDGDYLFIDCDTVVCDTLAPIDDVDAPLAAVIDVHLPKELWYKYFNDESLSRLRGAPTLDKHFNSGVFFVRDCDESRALYDRWHKEWQEARRSGSFRDQPPLHRALQTLGLEIKEIGGEWNCQLLSNFVNYIHNARIIHSMYSVDFTMFHILHQKSLYHEIRENGALTARAMEVINNPKQSFEPINFVCAENELHFAYGGIGLRNAEFTKSEMYLFTSSLCTHHPRAARLALCGMKVASRCAGLLGRGMRCVRGLFCR